MSKEIILVTNTGQQGTDCSPGLCPPNVACDPNTSCGPFNCFPALRPCGPDAVPCNPTTGCEPTRACPPLRRP